MQTPGVGPSAALQIELQTGQKQLYDALGNLASKPTLGTYDYAASGGCSVRPGPHAVRVIASHAFCYDGNSRWARTRRGAILWQR